MWKWWKCPISIYRGVFEMINGRKVLAWILKYGEWVRPSKLKFISHVVIFSLFSFFVKWPQYDWQIKYNLINEVHICWCAVLFPFRARVVVLRGAICVMKSFIEIIYYFELRSGNESDIILEWILLILIAAIWKCFN